MLTLNTILCPTDFSAGADYALHVAYGLARDHNGRVVLLHVGPAPVDSLGAVPPLPEEYHGAELHQRLEAVKVPDAAVRVERRVAFGEAAPEILRAAEDVKADLIVLGTHGRTGLGRLLMGSVAEHVVRRAPCLVLTVRQPLPRS